MPDITLTPAAIEHLRDEVDERILRIAFTTGCGGSGYRLGFASAAAEDDTVEVCDGITVAFDSMAAGKLEGAVIDYDETEDGYLLDHPDAVMAIWCG